MNLREDQRDRVLPTYARADLTIVEGEGCRVRDDAGREYLDFVAGIAVVGLGHRHPAVSDAAHAQLDRLWHVSNLYWTDPMVRLAGLLSERLGGAQAFFCNSGAEANEAAFKVARKARSRSPASRPNGRASVRSSPASRSRSRTTSSRSRPLSAPVASSPRSCSSRFSARVGSSRSMSTTCRRQRKSRARPEPCCGSTRSRPGSAAPGRSLRTSRRESNPIS